MSSRQTPTLTQPLRCGECRQFGATTVQGPVMTEPLLLCSLMHKLKHKQIAWPHPPQTPATRKCILYTQPLQTSQEVQLTRMLLEKRFVLHIEVSLRLFDINRLLLCKSEANKELRDTPLKLRHMDTWTVN